MKRIALILATTFAALTAMAATHATRYFTIDTPDDSWEVTDNRSLGEMGARIMLSRNDGTQGLTHVARIDYVDRPFTPASYLQSQIVQRRDNMARNASDLSAIADTTFAGYAAQRVKFVKQANGTDYNFTAIAFNAGFGTVMVIQGQQADAPAIMGRITSSIKLAVPEQPQSLEQLVEASKQSLKRRRATWDDNGEKLYAVSLPDSATVQLDMEIPFINLDAIDVTTFVQTKRRNWAKHRKDMGLHCLIVEMAARQGRNIKYVYHETRGPILGTLLILPEEVK